MTEPTNPPDRSIRFTYTNWQGKTSERHATPVSIRWGNTPWHPLDGWLMLAYDHDKDAEREFALVDFSATRPQPATVKPLELDRLRQLADGLGAYAGGMDLSRITEMRSILSAIQPTAPDAPAKPLTD